ncbi:hypothetical protein BDB01DRAFT_841125 [Pilobolus umbonatus]|nr:hypothetical protein BDB01DRAFT_841125 [Pilobolus umbonatus]
MSLCDEFKAKNFSLYGQWVGILSILLLIILGILRFTSHWVFSMVGWIIALLLVVLEIPLCIKFCPMNAGSFNACAVFLLLAAALYGNHSYLSSLCMYVTIVYIGFAGYKGQAYASSTVLGGTGVDNVRLAELRAEADTANAKADEYSALIKQLELDHISKFHDIRSLTSKAKQLEAELEKAEDALKTTSNSYHASTLKGEQLDKDVVRLEQELESAQKKNEDLHLAFNDAKEQMAELVRQLEII